MKNSPESKVRIAVVQFFSAECRGFKHDEVCGIKLPLMAYDGNAITVFITKNGRGIILHDGGRINDYLSDYGITVTRRGSIACRLYKRLADKHSFAFRPKTGRFEMALAKPEGEKVFGFASALAGLTFLVAPLRPWFAKTTVDLDSLS
ncbi:MAG: hypothetical protein HYV67_02220 [Candidatus Taylorbacteria bacterium]|nr:hypothetical protein [Candidatus Taylorbacteria bacterium]